MKGTELLPCKSDRADMGLSSDHPVDSISTFDDILAKVFKIKIHEYEEEHLS